MKSYSIRSLDTSSSDAINLVSSNCPSESNRYEKCRLVNEIANLDERPFYRKFFGAYDSTGMLIGLGGIKAADWASDTHILYMLTVEQNHRGKGVGSDLEMVRIQWMRDHFSHGRCLVSTKHKKRFERWNFKSVSDINDRHLMMLEF